MTLFVIGTLLTATSISSANQTLMCGAEPFKVQYLPQPTQVFQNNKGYVGFPIEDSGKLLALDCDLQKANKKLSLYAEQVSSIESQLLKSEEILQLYAAKYQKQLTEITTLEEDLTKVTTRAEICENKTSSTPWWKVAGYVILGVVVGGGVGFGAGAAVN